MDFKTTTNEESKIPRTGSVYDPSDAAALAHLRSRIDELYPRMTEDDVCRLLADRIADALKNRHRGEEEIADLVMEQFPHFERERVLQALAKDASERTASEKAFSKAPAQTVSSKEARSVGDSVTMQTVSSCGQKNAEPAEAVPEVPEDAEERLDLEAEQETMPGQGIPPEKWHRGDFYRCFVSSDLTRFEKRKVVTCKFLGTVAKPCEEDGKPEIDEWVWFFMGGPIHQKEMIVSRSDLETGRFRVLAPKAPDAPESAQQRA